MPTRRRVERDDLTGLPDRLCQTLYLRRASVSVDDYGAESTTWDVVTFRGRIYRDAKAQSLAGENGRVADQSRATMVTNDGRVCSGDEVATSAAVFTDESAGHRDAWTVEGDPFADVDQFGRGHHYNVPLRRVEG